MPAAFVQGRGTQGTNVSSISLAFLSAVVIGNSICVTGSNTDEADTNTISDDSGANGSYTQGTKFLHSTASIAIGAGIVNNVANAAHTVTFAGSGSNTRMSIRIAEVSGLHATPNIEAEEDHEGNEGDGAIASGLASSAAGAYVQSHISGNINVTFTAPTGWTAIGTASARTHAAYMITPDTNTISGSWTNDSTSHSSLISAHIFQVAAAGGGRTTKNTRSWPLGVNVGMGWRMPV
jgi:hypothetical protein